MRVPLHVDVQGRRVVIVGAGRAGRSKAERLAAAGADVQLVDTPEAADLAAAWLVITATGDEAVNDAVAAEAEAGGIWVNRADQVDGGAVAFAAGIDRGLVHVGVSTGGASPALAIWLRDRVASSLPPAVAELADLVAQLPRDEDGRKHSDLPFAEALAALEAGDRARAERLLRAPGGVVASSSSELHPCLIGVGVGPGDAGLVTLRAVDVLRAADRVLAPSTSDLAIGRAEVIVREAVPGVAVERVPFVMAVDGEARAAALAAAADRVVGYLDAGEQVAFVTLGDPNVYSTFAALAYEVRSRRPAVPVAIVPGIMAFQDLAARTGTVLVDGEERLVLLPAHGTANDDVVRVAVADRGTAVVVYKGGARLPELAAELDGAGRLDQAVVGELLGLPGERVAPLASFSDQAASYLATLIVPPQRSSAPEAAGDVEVDGERNER